MAIKGSLVIAAELAFLCTFAIFANCIASTSINRNSFPDGFLIGASSSAYQVGFQSIYKFIFNLRLIQYEFLY